MRDENELFFSFDLLSFVFDVIVSYLVVSVTRPSFSFLFHNLITTHSNDKLLYAHDLKRYTCL